MSTTLAINGGTPLRSSWPERGLIGKEEKAAVDALFDAAIAGGGAIGYGGAEETAYCEEFATFMGGGYADAVNSGTNAVYVALLALGLPAFSEVVVGPITDPGGMMPIPLIGCIPVVADAAPGCFNTGPEQIEAVITEYTRAILVPHIAGEPADIEGIMEVARRHNLLVVEDCAQAHCAKMNGKFLGCFGDVAAFSTMFGKHHCTGGQGGIVFTRNEKLYQRARWNSDRGKPFGVENPQGNVVAALNCNLNDLAACIGRVQLKKLPEIVRRRRETAAGLLAAIKDLAVVSMPSPLPGAEPSYWFLRLEFHPEAATCDKDTFVQALAAEGLPVNAHYAANTPHRFPWFREHRGIGNSGYPWAAPEYKGNANAVFECPNVKAVDQCQFTIHFTEAWGEQEVIDAAAILHKVEAAFKK